MLAFRCTLTAEQAKVLDALVAFGVGPKEYHVEDDSCRERLMQLLNGHDETFAASKPCPWQTFEQFTDILPAWSGARPAALVQRRQLYGGCCMTAASVAAHYALARHADKVPSWAGCEGTAPTPDVTQFMLHSVSAQGLRSFRDESSGTYCGEVLREMLCTTFVSEFRVIARQPKDFGGAAGVMELLRQRGPALITTVLSSGADDALLDPAVSVHTAAGDGPALKSWEVGRRNIYSFVLLAGRATPSGDIRFLVQAFWADKQFFEVDLAFLAGRGAMLVWADKWVEDERALALVPDAPWWSWAPYLQAGSGTDQTDSHDGGSYRYWTNKGCLSSAL